MSSKVSDTQPILTLVIPIKGRFDLLENLLNSFEGVESSHVEILVVYDVDEVVPENFKPKVSPKYVRSETSGLGPARNLGLREATGLYVLFCDADDILDLQVLVNLVFRLVANKYDVCITNYRREFRNEIRPILAMPSGVPRVITDPLEKSELNRFFYYCWNKICRTDYLRAQKIEFPTGEYEDVYWSILVIGFAETIYFDEHIYYTYKQVKNSAVQRRGRQHMNLLNQYQNAEKVLRARSQNTEFIQSVQQQAIRHTLFVICSTNRLDRHCRELLFGQLLSKVENDDKAIPIHLNNISLRNRLILQTRSKTLLSLNRLLIITAKTLLRRPR